MTEKDLKLIDLAYSTVDCDDVRELIKQAETEECRQRLIQREINLYHLEEARCGCL